MNSPIRSRVLFSTGLAALAALASPLASRAETQFVDSIVTLKSAINHAGPGDSIVVKNGIYTTSGPLTVKCTGATGKPVTISAESIGGVEITGTNGFLVAEPASHVVITGFNFTHAAGKNTAGEGTSDVRFTRNVFRCSGDGAYLSVSGDDVQVDHNEFADKKTAGNMIAVAGTGTQVARRLWIHHNYFHEVSTPGASGAEMIRFGLSTLSRSTGAGLVEHNLFSGCHGQNEMITNRVGGNTYRYNTFVDSPNSKFTLRHGDECLVYGNIFRRTEGLRIYGDRHQVFSNYFEANYIGISLGNGSVESPEGAGINGFVRPDNCVIAFNTFVDNRTHYQMSRRTPEGLGAKDTVFANNLVYGGSVAAKMEGKNVGAIWSNNLLWKVANAGDFPLEGSVQSDPLLAPGTEGGGVRRLESASPVIEAATGDFPLVAFDLDGQPRGGKKWIGADETNSSPAMAHLLAPADVGPNAELPPTPPPVQAPAAAAPTSTSIPTPTPSPAPTLVPTPTPAPPTSASPEPEPKVGEEPKPSL